MNFQSYTDDFQVYFWYDSDLSVIVPRIEACSYDVARWMSLNKLKLNNNKTELLVTGSQHCPVSQLLSFTSVDGSVIIPSDSTSHIGLIFDNNLNMEHQVAVICRLTFFHICNISRIRRFL